MVLTFDGDALDRFWLADYVQSRIAVERLRYPPPRDIGEGLGPGATVSTVAVARDCLDGFTEAYYARPEAFLEEATRRSQSAWGFVEDGVEDRFVVDLRRDLESGAWTSATGISATRSSSRARSASSSRADDGGRAQACDRPRPTASRREPVNKLIFS